MLLPKIVEIFKAKTVDGTYLPDSIEITVCLDTPSKSASAS
mgnify:CR=1 FL=1